MKDINHIYEVIIIGGGPTGLSCAIEAKKRDHDFLIIEKGLLVNSLYHFPTNMQFFSTSERLEIGNIPFISHTDKPTRKEALEYYRRIVESFEIPIHYNTEALSMTKSNDYYSIETSKGVYKAKHVIVNTGFYGIPKKLDVPGENLSKVKHYYDEAHPYIGRNIIVVGGANSACDVALETWQKGANVTMVVRQEKLYQKVKYWILPNIENRIKEGSIKAYFNSSIQEIKEETVTINTINREITIENDFVLAMTGYTPDYSLFSSLGIETQNDEHKTPIYNPTTLESNLSGVYLAGVILGGLHTSKFFIENTRHQAEIIFRSIKSL